MSNTSKKRIGLLGGFSHESTAEYYMRLHKKYFERHRDFYYPEMIVCSLDFQKFTDLENNDTNGCIRYTVEGIKRLENAGVDFIAMTANSPHAMLEELRRYTSTPILSIIDATLDDAEKQELKNLLLLGIKKTMRSGFYEAEGAKRGIAIGTPSAQHQDFLENLIFNELSKGQFLQDSRAQLLKLISSYDVDGVILGCTELPLILSEHHCAIPVLDTIEAHSNAILNEALMTGKYSAKTQKAADRGAG